MKLERMKHFGGIMAAMILIGAPILAEARDPGINQPGPYGGTAGVGVRPGVGAGRAGLPGAAGAGGPASGLGALPGAGAGRPGAPAAAAGGVGGPASGVGVRPGAGAGRRGPRR